VSPPLTPDLLLHAYAIGVFPMADPDEDDRVYWYAPDPRAVLPLDAFKASRSLRQTLRRAPFTVTIDAAFSDVITACAESGPGREETWISDDLREAYVGLHAAGHAHSVECWEGEPGRSALVGGLYGVALRGAFFGESMFHRATDASKVALAHLVARLKAGGFALLDVQMQTPHLARFGTVEIPRAEYEERLAEALRVPGRWDVEGGDLKTGG
jgi:leucyl/phenylalanyl-tRNA--protein transferase